MRLKTYLTEDYDWLTKAKAEFVRKIEKEGKFTVTVKPHTSTIVIAKRNKKTKHPTKGLVIYKDGGAVDIMVDLSVAKVMRSLKDWESILK